LNPYIPQSLGTIKLSLLVKGKSVKVQIRGKGNGIAFIKYDGAIMPTLVIPEDIDDKNNIEIQLGKTSTPIIYSANGILTETIFNTDKNILEFSLKSFVGHQTEIKIISPIKVKKIFINKELTTEQQEAKKDDLYELTIKHLTKLKNNKYLIEFESR
jgi:hypothetical protein